MPSTRSPPLPIHSGALANGADAAEELEGLTKSEVLTMLKFGADRIFGTDSGRPPTDAELEVLIDRTGKAAEQAEKDGAFGG
jgi:hypothetical protein